MDISSLINKIVFILWNQKPTKYIFMHNFQHGSFLVHENRSLVVENFDCDFVASLGILCLVDFGVTTTAEKSSKVVDWADFSKRSIATNFLHLIEF